MKIYGRINGDKKKVEHTSSSNETGMESDVGSGRVLATLSLSSFQHKTEPCGATCHTCDKSYLVVLVFGLINKNVSWVWSACNTLLIGLINETQMLTKKEAEVVFAYKNSMMHYKPCKSLDKLDVYD
ncbi:hypothetical protein N665_0049s0003 [Sinapis alba]|nr:hypothetical protein N665_0049s0003 [Sinapis alba]